MRSSVASGSEVARGRLSHKPLVLDVDDWEWGFALFYYGTLRRKLKSAARLTDANNIAYTWALERLASTADGVSVASLFLQGLFGGTLIPHARDTARFDPSKFDSEQIKSDLGLAGRKVVLFLGTPMKHKGIAQLTEAIEGLKRDDVTLLVVGATELQASRLPDKQFVRTVGPQPFSAVPRFQAAADLVVLFQAEVPGSARSGAGQAIRCHGDGQAHRRLGRLRPARDPSGLRRDRQAW